MSPAIYEVRRPRNVVAVGRCEEHGEAGHVGGRAKTAEGNLPEQRFQLARIVQEGGVDRRFDRAGSDAVDGDAVRPELDGQRAGQHADATLARAVRGEVRERELLVHRTDVDDLAGPPAAMHCCTKAWVAKNTPFRLTSSTASKSRSVTSQNAACFSMPALLTRTSRPPRASTLFATSSRTSATLPRLARRMAPRRPSACDLLEDLLGALRIAVVVDDDVGPSCARRTAMPRPMPLLLPVTSTFRAEQPFAEARRRGSSERGVVHDEIPSEEAGLRNQGPLASSSRQQQVPRRHERDGETRRRPSRRAGRRSPPRPRCQKREAWAAVSFSPGISRYSASARRRSAGLVGSWPGNTATSFGMEAPRGWLSDCPLGCSPHRRG